MRMPLFDSTSAIWPTVQLDCAPGQVSVYWEMNIQMKDLFSTTHIPPHNINMVLNGILNVFCLNVSCIDSK